MSDFGRSSWHVGRKAHRCEWCYGPIPAGEKHFHYTGVYGGEWQNWRMHEECHDDYVINDYEEFMPGDAPWPDRVKALMGSQSTALTPSVVK